METNCFLSIIVPAYNIEKYIGQCLDSLCFQNLEKDKYEIIVINDGSSDNTGNVIDQYVKEKSNIHVFHKANGGVSSARNLGLKSAIGKYVWFVDGDDLICYNILKDIYEQIKINHYPDLFHIGVNDFIETDTVDLEKKITCAGNEPHSGWMFTRIFKRSIIVENNIMFDENVALGEDDIFCVFVSQHIRTESSLSLVGYFYRQREGSALHSSISEENFMKYVCSYKADLEYSEKYEFFGYKRDALYKNMPNMMLFVAQLPKEKRKRYLSILKENKLFPLKNNYVLFSKTGDKISGFKRIRRISFTRKGFFYLKVYLLWKKGLNKIRKIK